MTDPASPLSPAPDPSTGARALSFITAGVPGIGGVLKQRPEDFLVEEIPAYEPAGSGEHIFMFVEKRNLSTMHLVRMLADHFGVRREAVGVAGLKDKLAVTRQVVSVHTPGKRPEDFPSFKHPQVEVHWVDLHANKLKRGHLKGNRFIVRVRNVKPEQVVFAYRSLAMLARSGVPNRVGEQRFGHLENNHLVGRALLLGDDQAACDLLLGPSAAFPDAQAEARALYAAGKFAEALEAFPRSLHTERRVLGALARGRTHRNALREIERREKSFYLTAWQSAVFNAVLDRRLDAGTLAMLAPGDLAFKHENGSIFTVGEGDLSPELDERLARGAVSPSGPMWGAKMMRASGPTDLAELDALAAAGVTPAQLDAFNRRDFDGLSGERRPLRVPLAYPDVEGGMDEHGTYIKCVFELPRGSFATVVMREIMKNAQADADEEDEPCPPRR
jgi:tRNA pseudouridine13 synthase